MTRPWYKEPSQYYRPANLLELHPYAGPHGVAIVNLYGEKTQPGWGHERFAQNYSRGFFDPKHIEAGKPFALVMRSLRILVVDIDGKNDGYKAAAELNLPPTLAETSKSGNGHHLFYVEDSTWDEALGFGQKDRIRMWQGIDIKSTGVVYHHTHQRWNNRPIVPLPAEIQEAINKRAVSDEAHTFTSARVKAMTDDDRVFERDSILISLRKPRTDGRDTSLFRCGAALLNLGVEPAYMEEKIIAAGQLWGVDDDVIKNKIIKNIYDYVWKD